MPSSLMVSPSVTVCAAAGIVSKAPSAPISSASPASVGATIRASASGAATGSNLRRELMIKDAEKLKQLSRQWATVTLLSNWSASLAVAGISDEPADEFYNLPLFLAYGALGDFLIQLDL